MTESEPNEFGYTEASFHPVVSVQVAEAKHPDTLQPHITVQLRLESDERYAYVLPLALAEGLRDQLNRMIAVAHDRHWDT